MNDFTDHIKILMFFLIGLAVAFIVGFSLDISRLWVSIVAVIVVIFAVIALLARFGRETE